jgi:hypothetical protein
VHQTLLEPNGRAPVAVYATWFKMYPGDARDRWRPGLLADPRVAHFWDEPRSIGRLFFGRLPRIAGRAAPGTVAVEGDVLWDAYLLYGRDASWDGDDTPPDPISWGRTILLTQETFRREFLSVLARP